MPHAIIIGAGIGGLSTAIGLRRAGWSVTVKEKWPEVVGIGAALGMWPAAQRALAQLGLSEDLARESVPASAGGLYLSTGQQLVGFTEKSKRQPNGAMISRSRLMELLLRHAHGVDIQTGVHATPATLVADRNEADVLIGADGIRSQVRTTFLPSRSAAQYTGLVGWRGLVDFESGSYGETWGEGSIFGNTPVAPGQTNFYAAVPVPATDLARYDDPDDNITAPGVGFAELATRFAGWRDPIGRILAEANPDRVLRHPIFHLAPAVPSFVDGNVAILGDAAHAMTPHIGRGACEAIVDAVALVEQLTTTSSVRDALLAYDRERRRASQRVAARSRTMTRMAHATGAGATARNALFRGVGLLVR